MAKNKNKKLILILMLIILTFSFCGCASVRAVTITNQDGSIEEQVYVSLDEKAVTDAGYNLVKLKQDVASTAIAEAQNFVENLNNKIFVDMLNATEETKSILQTYQDGIKVYSSSWEDNNYVISVKFKNIDVYCYYYGVDKTTKLQTTTEKHFLYNKVSFSGSTMYLKHHELYNKLKMQFSLKYMGLIESDTNQMLYTYTTDLRRQHSNADYVNSIGGTYYHTWIVDDVENEEILFHYNIANSGNWILICLAISFVVCGALFVVYFINNNHKQRRKDES